MFDAVTLPVYNSRGREKSAEGGVVRLAHFVSFVIPGTIYVFLGH
jgi:hypothetical protein